MDKTRSAIDPISASAPLRREVEAPTANPQIIVSPAAFATAVRTILENCKLMIGATVGYVALLSEDGSETDLLFLDAKGPPGAVAPAWPRPIHGLRAEALRLGQPVFDNDCDHSYGCEFFPLGHVHLANVLFAPCMVEGKALGLLCLVNKSGGFIDQDVKLAQSCAAVVAMGLHHTRAEEAVRESEARFKQLFEVAADALWLHDRGSIIEVNQQACQSLGYTRAELLQMQVSEVEVGVGPDELVRVWQQETAVPTSFSGRRRRKDGSTFPVEVRSTQFSLGGRHLRLAAARDITQRHRQAQELQESENRFRELFNHMKSGVAIYEFSQNGEEVIFKDFNQSAEQIESLSKEDLLGRDIREIFPGSETSGLREVILRVWRRGRPEHLPAAYYQDAQSSGWREHFIYKLPSDEVVVIYDNVTGRVMAEKALRESEERLRQLAEHIQDVFWITTPEVDQIVYVSPAYEKIWGRSCASLYKSPQSFLDAIHPEDRDQVLHVLEQCRLKKIPSRHTYRIIRPDGSTCWVEDRGFPVLDELGNLQRFTGVVTDITARKRMEDDLRTVKARLEYLLTASPAVIYSCEPSPPYRATSVSNNVASLLGYESCELIDHPGLWKENIHPEDIFGVHTAITLLMECGDISLEYRFRHKDGNYVWIQDELILVRDAQGTPMEMVGFLINISKRKQAEDALRRSETQYRSLVENTLDGYIIYKFPAGHFLFLNQRMCQLYGCSRRAGLRLSFRDLIVRQDHVRFQNWVQAHMHDEDHDGAPKIFTMRRRDETTFLAEVAVSRIYFQDKSAVQVVVRDISESERLRQQVQYAQKMQALGTMAAGIAHEIRSPLTVCSSAAQFILEDDLSPDFRRQCLEKMLTGITKASTIIENLLKFARSPERVEATRMELGAVINDTLALVTNQARLQNVSLKRVIPVAPIYFQGFAGLLPQAFMNLFLNAVNAMPDGGTLNVRLEPTEHEAVVIITDTGHGIAASDLPYIFDPFFSNSLIGQGTGLGLSICQSIIKQHRGSIEVESTLGQGTNFIVRLPRISPSKAQLEDFSG